LCAAVGAVVALSPAAAGLVSAVPAAPLPATLAAVYLGFVPAAVGYAAWAYVALRASSAASSSLLYVIPVVVMALSFVLLGEVPRPLAIAGGALVIAGIAVNRLDAASDHGQPSFVRPRA
jgi:drug/metabolite transporter (DMT)-like permease